MYKKLAILITFVIGLSATAQNDASFSQREVVYSHKNGMALTMFVTTPIIKNNHRALIWVTSGGYYSNPDWVPKQTRKAAQYLERGYTVFFVLHGSAPLYTSVDAISDVQKAVQFIRYQATDFNIDPDHIGITGNSSGANLALLVANTEAKATAVGEPPMASISSRVQAVACFYPPTDFLNYARPGNASFRDSTIQKMVREGWIASAFQFKKLNPKDNTYSFIKDEVEIEAIYKKLSPIYTADQSSAPTLIYHGDKDVLVPIYQSEQFIAKLIALGIPAKLVVKKGAGHGWDDDSGEIKAFADWFDVYL